MATGPLQLCQRGDPEPRSRRAAGLAQTGGQRGAGRLPARGAAPRDRRHGRLPGSPRTAARRRRHAATPVADGRQARPRVARAARQRSGGGGTRHVDTSWDPPASMAPRTDSIGLPRCGPTVGAWRQFLRLAGDTSTRARGGHTRRRPQTPPAGPPLPWSPPPPPGPTAAAGARPRCRLVVARVRGGRAENGPRVADGWPVGRQGAEADQRTFRKSRFRDRGE